MSHPLYIELMCVSFCTAMLLIYIIMLYKYIQIHSLRSCLFATESNMCIFMYFNIGKHCVCVCVCVCVLKYMYVCMHFLININFWIFDDVAKGLWIFIAGRIHLGVYFVGAVALRCYYVFISFFFFLLLLVFALRIFK